VIDAIGHGSLVNLDNTAVVGGTLETRCGGFVQTVGGGNSTLDSVTVACSSEIQVSENTSLTLEHTIDNNGTITLGTPSIGDSQTGSLAGDAYLAIDDWVTLTGRGDIVLASASAHQEHIVGGAGGGTLDNVNNKIEGAGNIGTGDGHFSLVNETCGTIEANDDNGLTLTIDTGRNTIINASTLAACDGGKLDVESAVNNEGGAIKVFAGSTAGFEKSVTGGSATIDGGTLKFDAAAGVDVTFASGHYGELVLGDVKHFSGAIFGFGGTPSDSPASRQPMKSILSGSAVATYPWTMAMAMPSSPWAELERSR
jgi:hypothetical protein